MIKSKLIPIVLFKYAYGDEGSMSFDEECTKFWDGQGLWGDDTYYRISSSFLYDLDDFPVMQENLREIIESTPEKVLLLAPE